MSVFINPRVLSFDFLPEFLPHREGEIKRIAEIIENVSKKRVSKNVFIHGKPGIGKTATIRLIFRDLEDITVFCSYVNCWIYRSATSIFSKIGSEMGVFVQRRGVGKDEILERIREYVRKKDKKIVVCLDEVDQFVFNDPKGMYDFVRLSEILRTPCCTIFISNNPHIFMNLDSRVRSSLRLEEVEFRPYSFLEMKDILRERAEKAFRAFEQGAIALSANHAMKNGGDVRIGLECLYRGGVVAEKEGSNILKTIHVKKILQSVKPVKPEIVIKNLRPDERMIIEILKEKKEAFSSELYEEYKEICGSPVSQRRFRDFLRHLEHIGLVSIEVIERGIRGKKRLIKLNLSRPLS